MKSVKSVDFNERKLTAPEWHQQEWESPSAYDMFKKWLNIPEPKSFNTLFAILGYQKDTEEGKKAEFNIRKFSSSYLWSPRVAAYNNYVATLEDKEKAKLVKKRLENIHKQIEASQTVMMSFIGKYLERFKAGKLDFDKLSTEQQYGFALRTIESIVKVAELERKMLGEPTEITKATVDIQGGIDKVQMLNIVTIGSKSKLLDEINKELESQSN
jgi:hypothetical protein